MNFKTINNFLDFREKCPFCNSRNKLYYFSEDYNFFSKSKCDMDRSKIFLYFPNNKISLSINIFTNELNNQKQNVNSFNLLLQCNKFHFLSNCFVSLENNEIKNISLKREHFTKNINEKIFGVDNNYILQKTEIKISSFYGTNSKEIILPLLEFDLKNNKKLIKKLNTVEMIG